MVISETPGATPGRLHRVCSQCSREFIPSSNHLRCPACRSREYKKPCPLCREPMRSKSSMCESCFRSRQKFEMNGNWKGGRTRHKNGYTMVRVPEHPRSPRNRGYVFENILVMEDVLGRYLVEGETVHHKNGIKDDNRKENLELWTRNHPSGVRVRDLVEYATEVLLAYSPERLAK